MILLPSSFRAATTRTYWAKSAPEGRSGLAESLAEPRGISDAVRRRLTLLRTPGSAFHRSFLNSSTVRPASRMMPSMVQALTGSWRGIVTKGAALRHHDVPGAFPHHCIPRFFQSPYRAKVRYSRQLRHRLDRDFHFSHVRFLERVPYRPEILSNGVPNVLERLGFGRALRPTTRQSRTGGGEAFFRHEQSDSVVRYHFPFILRRSMDNGEPRARALA